jgi:hypothetical protein
MKWYKSADGEQRIWYEQDEIEDIAADELRRAELFPTLEAPIVDLEKFIESHLHAKLDQYGLLPADVLGSTEFEPGEPPRVLINRDLTTSAVDEPRAGAFGRWRATMAHEGCHILLHRVLFELNPDQALLFDVPSKSSAGSRLMRCLHRDIVGRGGGDWREVQANRGMAALLMPRALFREIAREELKALGFESSDLEDDAENIRAALRRIAPRCGVSQQAAGIRLETLELIPLAGAVALPFE